MDFKIEVGRDAEGRLVLADEISPDTCRFWDKETGEKLDRTASAATWAASRRPTPRCCAGCRR